MPAPLDIDQLQTFVAIVDTGSFTRAADKVFKTQSAVSMQMRRLEERVGKTLVCPRRPAEPAERRRRADARLCAAHHPAQQRDHRRLSTTSSSKGRSGSARRMTTPTATCPASSPAFAKDQSECGALTSSASPPPSFRRAWPAESSMSRWSPTTRANAPPRWCAPSRCTG
jgi:hypothetical protein